MIDKSTKQHYEMQGGGPNYLGKQKMVTAPKKWLSSPDHEPAELAYITEKEKDILLDLNLYGSLKNGKPNRGPSGIMSLQGDMGGWSGGSSGGGNTGGGGDSGPDPREQAIQRAKEAAAKRATEQKKQEQEKRSKEKGKSLHGGPTVKEALAPIKKKKQEEQEKISKELGEALHGGPKFDKEKAKLTKLIRDQALEKMDVIPDDTTQLDLNKFGETVIPEALPKGHPDRIEEETEEAVKQLSTKAGTKEALKEFKALDTGRRYTPDFDLLEKLGVTRPEGILGSLVDTGQKYFDPKKMLKDAAIKYGMKKMGLGAINPYLGIASMLKDTKLNPLNWFKRKPVDMTAFNKLGLYDEGTPAAADTLTAKARDAYDLPLEGNVIAENIAKFTGKDTGGKSMMEDFYANQGSWSERVGEQLGTNLQEAGATKMSKEEHDQLLKDAGVTVGGGGQVETFPRFLADEYGSYKPYMGGPGATQSIVDEYKGNYPGLLDVPIEDLQKRFDIGLENSNLMQVSKPNQLPIMAANGGLINLFKYGGFLG